MPKVKFFTLGCKVNQYDTQKIREDFLRSGFQEINNGNKADIYVVNTCTVTANADRKSRYFIHYAHRQNPRAGIIVTGCYAQLDKEQVSAMPGVKRVVSIEDQKNIPRLLNYRRKTAKLCHSGISGFSGHTRAFLKIQEGCVNFCSYCRVPLARGRLKSKPLQQIRAEALELVRSGFKEIVLCGICLGSYGRDLKEKIDLVDAIEIIEAIPGLLRIRLSSIEAGDVSERLIKKMADSAKLCRHLHIPLQSGDDRILKKMNRRLNSRDYLALAKKIKKEISGVSITTDLVVGFPGETEQAFGSSLKLIRRIMPLRAHIFPYSPRPKTAAYNFSGRVPPEEIQKRIARLKKAVSLCSLAYKKQFLKRKMEVLIEGRDSQKRRYWQGYTGNYIKVLVKSERNLKNRLISLSLLSPRCALPT